MNKNKLAAITAATLAATIAPMQIEARGCAPRLAPTHCGSAPRGGLHGGFHGAPMHHGGPRGGFHGAPMHHHMPRPHFHGGFYRPHYYGGYYRSWGYRPYGYPVYTSPVVYSTPVVTSPVVVQQPVYTQPIVQQPVYQQAPVVQQPVYQQAPAVQQAPVVQETPAVQPAEIKIVVEHQYTTNAAVQVEAPQLAPMGVEVQKTVERRYLTPEEMRAVLNAAQQRQNQ